MIKDTRYIIKRVIISILIILIMTFIKSCTVHAESVLVTSNTTIDNYNLPGWWTMYTYNRNLILRYRDWQYETQDGIKASFGYLTTCATGNFSVNNGSADCSDGCFNNEFQVVNVGSNCTVHMHNSTADGKNYYIFYSIKQVGWTNADTLPIIFDTLTFKSKTGSNVTVEFLDNYLTNEDYYATYATANRLDELISATQSQTNTIINNNNNNTNSIINNNNQNTQDIIDNQNENSQTCSRGAILKWSSGKGYDDNGVLEDNSTQYYTNKIYAKGGGSATITGSGGGRLVLYDKNGNYLDWYGIWNGRTITISSSAYYIAISNPYTNISVSFANEVCANKTDLLNDSVSNLNDNITDDSAPNTSDFNDAIDSVKDALPTNSTISSLVTMPITFLQKIIDALNGTCQPIVIGELYEYNMTMPCINPSDYIGIIWNIIDVICAGFFAFYFGKKLVLIFHNITSMKEGGLKEAYD